jgi:pimeloyl-ACP methyl ester carboxylesterase
MIRITIAVLIAAMLTGCKENTSNNNVQETTKQPDKPQPQTGYAPVHGINMYYEIHGQGKPLVLIHGGGSTIGTTFGNILPTLAEKHQVIAVELQAHGHTNDRDTPSSFEQDADDVAALLKHLKIDKADFFGFSNGGNTAMRIGTRHPEMVNKLIIASAFYKREGMVKGFFEFMPTATLSTMPPYLREAFLKINPDSAKLQTMFELDKNRMVNFKDWSDADLTAIKAPALVIAGDKDVMTASHTAEMASKIPKAELLIVPGNHGSFILEAGSPKTESKIPGLVLATIEEFLNK